jgi:outer membrane protein assembly factor BamB
MGPKRQSICLALSGMLLLVLATGCQPKLPPSGDATHSPTSTAAGTSTQTVPPPPSVTRTPSGRGTPTPTATATDATTQADTPTPTVSPTATTSTLDPAGEGVVTTGWRGLQADPGHSGFVNQRIPVPLEPKWVAQPAPAMSTSSESAIIADDLIVVVGSAPYGFRFDSPPDQLPVVADRSGFALYAFRVADGTQKWRFPTGGLLIGTPQIAYGKVYAVTWQAPTAGEQTAASSILCLRAEDGAPIWQRSFPDAHLGALTVQDGVVVASGRALKQAFALDADTGETLWSAPLLQGERWSVNAPAVERGRVILADETHLYGFELQTGRLLWRLDAGDQGAPFAGFDGPITVAEGWLFVSARHPVPGPQASSTTIYALSPVSGQIRWNYRASSDSYWQVSGRSYHLGRVFCAARWARGSGVAYGIVALNALDGVEVWRTGLDDLWPVYPPGHRH